MHDDDEVVTIYYNSKITTEKKKTYRMGKGGLSFTLMAVVFYGTDK